MHRERSAFAEPRVVIVIGAMKSGTTSLHRYLDLHPEISMSLPKELNFFVAERNWRRGPDWYRRQLGRAPWVGESSTNYTKFPMFSGVPKRIQAVVPEARLIYLVRDPIDRMLSHYLHLRSKGQEARPLDEALLDPRGRRYVYPSCYHFQLEQYAHCFPDEQILVVDHHELLYERRTVLRRVFEFLGVAPDVDNARFDRLHHRSSDLRQPRPLARRLVALPGGQRLREMLPRWLETELPRPELSESLRAEIAELLRPDAAALRAKTGLAFGSWSV